MSRDSASKRFVTRDGIRLAYEEHGQGPAGVLIQGLGMAGEMWMELPRKLASSGFRAIIPDNRGTGASDAPPPPYRMSQVARDAVAVLEHADAGPALVAGISFGGMIAQRVAIDYPERVRGLVLAATSPGLPHGRLMRPQVLYLMVRSMMGDLHAARRFRNHLVFAPRLKANPRLFDEWDRRIAQNSVRWQAVAGQLTAASMHSAGAQLGRIRCPTEIITGDHDEIIPPQNAKVLASRIQGARLLVLPGAGHAFPLEYPGILEQSIRRVHARASASAP